jgi:hypothetical protein
VTTVLGTSSAAGRARDKKVVGPSGAGAGRAGGRHRRHRAQVIGPTMLLTENPGVTALAAGTGTAVTHRPLAPPGVLAGPVPGLQYGG